jgi:hypothetical protein
VSAERSPGSDRGRAAIDWQAAFVFYLSLPAERRDYRTVADEFGVSRRTVERHGRQDNWMQRAHEHDRDTVRAAAERLREERADTLAGAEKLVDATYVSYANQLVAGEVKVTPSHVVKLFELRERIWGLQDAVTVDQLEQVTPPADPIDPTERKLQVLRALEDAGVLDRLLHPDQHQEDRDDEGDADDEAGQDDEAGRGEDDEREIA